MFVVFEGIDGAGCGAQRKSVSEALNQKGYKTNSIKYPWPHDSIGKAIYAFLKEGKEYTVETQFLLYATQFVADKDRIQALQKENDVLIADRYFTSTLAYQGMRGMSEKVALNFASNFHIVKPDLIFYLNTKPETAMLRKQNEAGKTDYDRNEKDKKLQQNLVNQYNHLASDQIWSNWEIVDNEQSLDRVTDTLVNKIEDVIKRSV